MRVKIKSVEAEIIDTSTKIEFNSVILYWKIRYSVSTDNTYDQFKLPYNTIEGELHWKEEQVNLNVITKYIKGLFK